MKSKKSLHVADTLRQYWKQVKKNKISFFIMLILIPLGALVIDVLLPYFLSQAIGGLTKNDFEATKQFLYAAAGVGLMGALFNYGGFQAMVVHESKTIKNLRKSVFEQLIQKDVAFFNNSKVGAMTSRYIDFVRAQIQIQDLFIIRTLGFLLSVSTGVVILAQYSLILAAAVLGLILILAAQIRLSAHFRRNWRHERKTLVSDIHGAVADSLTNNLIVKTFAGEKQEISELSKSTARFEKLYRKDIGFTVAEGSSRVALMVGVQVGSVAFAANMVLNGTLSLAVAVFLLAYMQRIGSQLFVLGEILNNFDQAFLDAEPMTKMLMSDNAISNSDNAQQLLITPNQSTIAFNNVSFAFEDFSDPIFTKLSLEIPAGQKIGLVGHSGAGKTTITQLLLRFYDVTAGEVTINGHDLRSVTQESLRRNISYVPQEPLLFHRSLRDNIAYGKPHATTQEILEAARKAHALEFIEKLPQGLETLVGERGVKLSGGQRQRIAIARAILKDAPILVLDEATSALDSESEKAIQAALVELMNGKTAIVIAHRLSTIQRMDRIIVLEKGHIIEDGNHQKLLAKKGLYARLWEHQSGGFIDE